MAAMSATGTLTATSGFAARDGTRSSEEVGHGPGRRNGGGQADSLGGLLQQPVEALEGQRQVGSALASRKGMDLVDDDGRNGAKRLSRFAREHEVKRFGRRDEDVGRIDAEATPLLRGRVAGPHAHARPRPFKGRVYCPRFADRIRSGFSTRGDGG